MPQDLEAVTYEAHGEGCVEVEAIREDTEVLLSAGPLEHTHAATEVIDPLLGEATHKEVEGDVAPATLPGRAHTHYHGSLGVYTCRETQPVEFLHGVLAVGIHGGYVLGLGPSDALLDGDAVGFILYDDAVTL